MSDYFKRKDIGSTELACAVVSVEPLNICCDLLARDVEPSSSMEMGKIFEDKIEQDYSGKPIFDDKYFNSNVSSWPAGVLEIIESDDVKTAIEGAKTDPKHYTKSGALSKSYEHKFHVLDQIAAHDYRRPIPKPAQEKLGIMTERFAAYPLRLADYQATIGKWLSDGYVYKIMFQVEHFWKHESNAECRAKFDMIWILDWSGVKYAVPFDLKVTANFSSFVGNWKSKYIWQSKHYLEGFADWCKKNGYLQLQDDIGHAPIYYLVQESEPPQITHCWNLSAESLDYLTTAYNIAIPQIWEWILNDRKVSGFMPQQTVNRWGKSI